MNLCKKRQQGKKDKYFQLKLRKRQKILVNACNENKN